MAKHRRRKAKPYCVVRIGRGSTSFTIEHCATTRRAAENARDRIAFKRAQYYGAQGIKFVVIRDKPRAKRSR